MLNPILSEGECSLLRSLIDGADSIVLCVHQNPDGDAMGSMLGMGEALRMLGKDPLMVVPDQFPDYLHWLPNSEKVVRYDKRKDFVDTVLKIADLVICLDFNTPSRTDEMAAALCASPAKKVLIDHHPGPEVDTVLCISHPEMSSASELVFRVIWQLGLFDRLGQHYAVPVYCGMMTDTGGFTFNSNDPDIFFIISQLLTKRIDKDKIYRNVYYSYTESRLRLMGYLMYEKLEYFPEEHVAMFALTEEEMKRFNFIRGDAEGFVNLPLQIKGTRLSISLREDTEKPVVRVSLRSVGDFPCNEMAERFFNGGGHLNAAGGWLPKPIDSAVLTARQAIKSLSKKE